MFQHVQTCANLAEVPALAFIAGALVMATFHRRPRRQASEGLWDMWDMQTFEHAAKHDLGGQIHTGVRNLKSENGGLSRIRIRVLHGSARPKLNAA